MDTKISMRYKRYVIFEYKKSEPIILIKYDSFFSSKYHPLPSGYFDNVTLHRFKIIAAIKACILIILTRKTFGVLEVTFDTNK